MAIPRAAERRGDFEAHRAAQTSARHRWQGIRMRLTPAVALLGAAFSLGFTACGDDDDGDSGQPQAFEVQVTEENGDARVTAPESARPGAVEIRFTNNGKSDHSVQIVQIADGHTPAEVKEAGDAWAERGEPLPGWITFAGGIGSTRAGGSGTAVVDLEPGEYAAFDIEGRGPEPFAAFTVDGDESEPVPDVSAAIEAVDYGFEARQLEAGSQPVLFENTGEEPHHLAAAPLKPGKSLADLRRYIESERGESPIVESESFNTAIVSGGRSEVVDLRLEAGEYALLCFIPDRAGGPPHAVKGMAAVAKVQ